MTGTNADAAAGVPRRLSSARHTDARRERALVLFMTTRLEWVPRSVIPLYLILLVGLLGGPRLLYRWAKDSYLKSQAGQGVLIIGAGRAGEMLLRDLFHDPEQLASGAEVRELHPRFRGAGIVSRESVPREHICRVDASLHPRGHMDHSATTSVWSWPKALLITLTDALQMWRHGPALYRHDFAVTARQVEAWSRRG